MRALMNLALLAACAALPLVTALAPSRAAAPRAGDSLNTRRVPGRSPSAKANHNKSRPSRGTR